jgi:hypothetical protein
MESSPSSRPGPRQDHRRVVLYGDSVLLASVGATLGKWQELEVICLSAPLPGLRDLEELAPDVILFDHDCGRPGAAFALLEIRPGLVLLGISPDGDVVRLWTGRQLPELSSQDLKDVIQEQLAMGSAPHQARPVRKTKEEREL